MQKRFRYVNDELPEKLKDPQILATYRAARTLSRAEHPELLLADFFEQIGAYAKWRLFDERSWLDIAGPQITRAWESLEPIITIRRNLAGQAAWENFEHLAVKAELWRDRHPDGNWQRGLPRMVALKKGGASVR